MKKVLSIVVLTVMLVAGTFVLTGCGDKENTDNNTGTEQTANNNLIAENEKKDNELAVGKYKVEKEDNAILVITNDGSAISTTSYIFENGTVNRLELTQECISNEVARTVYDMAKSEPTITERYTSIDIDGATIKYVGKDDMILAFKEMTYDEMYQHIYETYKAFM